MKKGIRLELCAIGAGRVSAYSSFGFSSDGILPSFCWLTSAFSYKFSFSSGRTVRQFPTAQSLVGQAMKKSESINQYFEVMFSVGLVEKALQIKRCDVLE